MIPNGHRLPPLSDRQREFILWVGRSADFKRPGLFIDLAEKISGEKFTMICQQATGDDDYDSLVARAEQVKNLEFIKRVPFGEIDNYFQRAKVFVNTSDAEGFPNTFIQACKSATPILSLNVNPDDFLSNYNCGVCCDNDTDKFPVALGQMLKNASYKELSRNAREYAKDKHDISKICDKYKELFINLKEDIIDGAN
jgi:glycosyltransferase involved in cell wall biosynthesis